MKKNDIEKWRDWKGRITPEYIVAHAKWRKSRGRRRPSLPYGKERNPEEALKVAFCELSFINPSCISSLEPFVYHITKVAKLTARNVSTHFVDLKFSVTPNSDPSGVYQQLKTEMKIKHNAYLDSPEHLEYLKEERDRIKNNNIIIFGLMMELEELDFTNHENIINWFCRLQGPSDNYCVTIPWEEIILKFYQKGYYSNVYTKQRIHNKETHARYLIGQALLCLTHPIHSISQVINQKANDWNHIFSNQKGKTA